MSQKYLLGIDAGGTKVDILITDLNGKSISSFNGGPASWNASKNRKEMVDNLVKNIEKAILKTKIKKIKFASIFIGIAGIDSPLDQKEATKMIKSGLKKYLAGKFYVGNDIEIVRRAGCDCSHGVALIAGTGTNCFGINEAGEKKQSSGMGHLMADQGGGYWIGQQILQASVKSYDRRGPKTVLESLVMDYFKLKDFRNIVNVIYKDDFSKGKIGDIARLLHDKRCLKDKLALQIMNNAAKELFEMLRAVVVPLKLSKKEFNLVVIGGVLTKQEYIKKRFALLLKKRFSKVKLKILKEKPVVGAILMAKDQLK